MSSIKFRASLHHSNAALTFYADGDCKIQLSVDGSELPKVSKALLLLRGATFEIVIPETSINRGRSEGNGTRRKVYR